RLLTIHYAPSRVFDAFAARELQAATPGRTSAHLFIGLLEAIVDRYADALEQLRGELDTLSHRIFREYPTSASGGRREDRMLRDTLAAIGRAGDAISFIRDSQVSA